MWWYVAVLLPVAVILWLLYEWYEHRAVEYNTTVIEHQQLPKATELRICLITDLHNNQKNLPRLLEQIRSSAPHILLLAGDLIDKHKRKNNHAEHFLVALSKLGIPMFYSEGNHELAFSKQWPEEWKQFLSALPENVCFLDNQSVEISLEVPVCISGLSLPEEYYKKGSLYKNDALLPEILLPKSAFHIMMAHNPEYASEYAKYHADFIVSGHLHGGLLRLPFFGGVVSPRLRLPKGGDAGLVKLSGTSRLFISRGLGSHTIPLRFFNRVEVNFLVLKGIGNHYQKIKEME